MHDHARILPDHTIWLKHLAILRPDACPHHALRHVRHQREGVEHPGLDDVEIEEARAVRGRGLHPAPGSGSPALRPYRRRVTPGSGLLVSRGWP